MPHSPDTAALPVPTLAEAWALWLAYRTHSARPLRASTLADYESIYRRHIGPALGDLPLDALDGAALARFTIAKSAQGVSAKRLSNILVPLRACLRWHHRIGALTRDPSAWFEPSASSADERRILAPLQIERLLAELPAFYRPFVEFAAYVGTRAGEQRALTWTDVDLVARTVRIDKTYYRNRLQRSTKTRHNRTAPLPSHVAAMLAEWRSRCPPSPADLVFPRAGGGGPLDLDTFRARVLRPAVLRAGLPASTRIHDLRHTSASLYLQSGATLREVMEIHGWRQMQTAVRYLHTGGELGVAADRVSAARDAALSAAPPSERPADSAVANRGVLV